MNITILNWRDAKHPLAGGAEISLLEHATYWKKQGATITWFASRFPNSKKREIVNGITYIRSGSHFTVHLWVIYLSLRGRLSNPDVIIDCFHFIPFFSPLVVRKTKIIALINEVAGQLWFSNLPYIFAFIGYHVEKFFFLVYKNTPFITASVSTRDELMRVGIASKNITIIHHGISDGHVLKKITKEKKPTLLFLGRISTDKGIKDALLVYKEVKKEIKDLSFWIIGKEEKKGELAQLLKELSLDMKKDGITYFGFISNTKKYELLKRAWLLLHTSVKEGWGLTVIEAASQGTPTIGYNVEGLRDSIVHNKTGILTEPNPMSMVNSAIKLLRDPMTLQRICKNAVTWSEKFNWEESGKKSWEYINR